jgi:hypothetical protein
MTTTDHYESTVRHEDRLPEGVEVMANRSREAEEREEVIKRRRLTRSDSIVRNQDTFML